MNREIAEQSEDRERRGRVHGPTIRDLEAETQALAVKIRSVGIEAAADGYGPVIIDAEIVAGGARRKGAQQDGVANRDDRKERRVEQRASVCARRRTHPDERALARSLAGVNRDCPA